MPVVYIHDSMDHKVYGVSLTSQATKLDSSGLKVSILP